MIKVRNVVENPDHTLHADIQGLYLREQDRVWMPERVIVTMQRSRMLPWRGWQARTVLFKAGSHQEAYPLGRGRVPEEVLTAVHLVVAKR